MRNIHVLPTEKPSKLFYNVGGALLFTDYENYNGVNICITSDEEIKVGDYVINSAASYVFQHYFAEGNLYKECKKIILTTDQDLIKDGVQAIDDDFLEWFVKNPSCEFVEIDNRPKVSSFEKGFMIDNPNYNKIIIPKEEAKQEGYICPHTKLQCDNECCVSASDCHIKTTIGIISEPKQETLENIFNWKPIYASSRKQETIEQASEYYAHNYFYMHVTNDYKALKQGFEAGVKWQQEQDKNTYSEDDISTAIAMYLENKSFSEIIKQLKNK